MGTNEQPPLPPFLKQISSTEYHLRLKVIPGARKNGVVGVHGDRVKIKVIAAPEKGRANEAVVETVEEWLGGVKVELLSGETSRDKVVRIRCKDGGDVVSRIRVLTAG